MKIVYLALIMLMFSACGYSPSAKHSRAVVGESISTSVVISAVDPENTVIIKDSVDAAVIQVFHASLVPKEFSQTHLVLSLSNPSYSPIQYDTNGFVVAYRTTVNLSIARHTNGEDSKTYNARGTFDFSITPNAIISDKQRFDAIRFSSIKAIESFVAQVSSEGARAEKSLTNPQPSSISSTPKVEEKPKKSTVSNTQKVKPMTSMNSRLDSLSKLSKMKKNGLLPDEEFEAMKREILTK